VKQLASALLVLVCLAVSAEATSRVSEKLIICHGDSITAGSNLADKEKYPGVLNTLVPGVRVTNTGIGGNTSSQGLARFEKDVLRHHPDLVILLFGTNDSVLRSSGKYRVPVEKYRENLRQMVLRCRKANAEVVLCTLLPIIPEPYFTRHPKEFYDAEGGLEKILLRYRAAAMDVGRELKVPVVDLYKVLEKDLTLLRPAPDGVHPNARGAKAIAQEIAKLLSAERKPVALESVKAETGH
jgi:lysophospholipase L1-like esterase